MVVGLEKANNRRILRILIAAGFELFYFRFRDCFDIVEVTEFSVAD
jgi:hypothetical protein